MPQNTTSTRATSPLKPTGLHWDPESAPTDKAREGERIRLTARSPHAPDGTLVEFMLSGLYPESSSDKVGDKRLVGKVKAPMRGGSATAGWLVRLPSGYLKPTLFLSANLGMDGTKSPGAVEIPFEPNPDCCVVDLQLKTDEGAVVNTGYEISASGSSLCKGTTDHRGNLSAALPAKGTEFLLSFRWEYQDYSILLTRKSAR